MKTMRRWSLRHGLALDGRTSQGSVPSCKLYLCVFLCLTWLDSLRAYCGMSFKALHYFHWWWPSREGFDPWKKFRLSPFTSWLWWKPCSLLGTPWVTIRSGTPPCPWHGVHHGRPPGRQSSLWNHPGHGCIHQVLELRPLWCMVAVALVSESAPGALPNYKPLPTTRMGLWAKVQIQRPAVEHRYHPYWATYDLEACLVLPPISATICVICHGPLPVSVQQPDLLPWQVDEVHMGPGGFRGCQDHGRPQVVLSHSLGIGWGTGQLDEMPASNRFQWWPLWPASDQAVPGHNLQGQGTHLAPALLQLRESCISKASVVCSVKLILAEETRYVFPTYWSKYQRIYDFSLKKSQGVKILIKFLFWLLPEILL